MSFNTKTYDSTNNNYNTNFDTYIIGSNNIPVNGNLYYNNKFGKLMTSFIVPYNVCIKTGIVIIVRRIVCFCVETHLSISLFNFKFSIVLSVL